MKWGRKGGDKPSTVGVGGVSFDDSAAETPLTGAPADAAIVVDAPSVDPDADTGGIRTMDMTPAAEAPVATKRLVFGRGAREPKPKVEKVRVEKTKPEKAPRLPKVKSDKSARRGREEESSLPITVVIDFFMGVSKEREAEVLARAQIEKSFDAPNASYYYTQRWRDGIAIEIQEGGGKAYLPEVLAKLDEDPNGLVAVAMSNRFAQVRLDPDTKSLETLLLASNQEPPEGAFIALPSRPMKPFDRRGSRVFLSGIALLSASAVAMLFSVGAFFIDTEAWSIPYIQQTSVKDLPMAQSSKIAEVLAGGADCVLKMEYVGGSWSITPGYDNGGVCGSNRPAADIVVPVDGTAPPVAGGTAPPIAAVPPVAAGAPVTPPSGPGAPAGMPVPGAAGPSGPAPGAPASPAIFGPPAGAPVTPGR